MTRKHRAPKLRTLSEEEQAAMDAWLQSYPERQDMRFPDLPEMLPLATPLPAEVEASLMILHRIWRTIPPEERIRFLTIVLTEQERRALQFGFDAGEDNSA